MKAYLCNECKFNKNGWCHKYQCNGKAKMDVCYKYKDNVDIEELCKEFKLTKFIDYPFDMENIREFTE